MRVEQKVIVNVLGPDNLRIGQIIGRKETRLWFIQKVTFGFVGKNNHGPAFFGWCKSVDDITKFLNNRFPDYSLAKSEPGIDQMLDHLEDMMQN